MRPIIVFVIISICSSFSLHAQQVEVPSPADSLVKKADEHFAKLAAGEQLNTDAEAINYVNKIMRGISTASGYDPELFKVYIQNSISINAGMYPNGGMILTSGLLLRLSSREELSFIIGHELSHYLLGHFAEGRPDDRDEAILRSLIREYTADSMGLELVVSAGLPSIAAVHALEKLPPSSGNILSFLNFKVTIDMGLSHPPTPRRVARIRQQGKVTPDAKYSSEGDYYDHLTALRNATRLDMLVEGERRNNKTMQIITIDSLINNLPAGDSTEYCNYLRFQQSEAILSLMRTSNSMAFSDLQYGKSLTTYRNNDSKREETYYEQNLSTIFGADALKEVHWLFNLRLKKNIQELSTSEDYRLEAMRLDGLYLERLEQYADAREVIIEYLAGKPTHPSRRFARSLLGRMPKKNRKQPKY